MTPHPAMIYCEDLSGAKLWLCRDCFADETGLQQLEPPAGRGLDSNHHRPCDYCAPCAACGHPLVEHSNACACGCVQRCWCEGFHCAGMGEPRKAE